MKMLLILMTVLSFGSAVADEAKYRNCSEVAELNSSVSSKSLLISGKEMKTTRTTYSFSGELIKGGVEFTKECVKKEKQICSGTTNQDCSAAVVLNKNCEDNLKKLRRESCITFYN